VLKFTSGGVGQSDRLGGKPCYRYIYIYIIANTQSIFILFLNDFYCSCEGVPILTLAAI